ncbi:hypothetical protein E6W26_29145 [Pseudomonas aeruginosa]|uniref:hypothetical protein n=1 Tax=Pseudomonas aeruginosa TaxID=287 RepID=UPI00109DB564|nr:hypothetical protein [Pseudomonas aeruginosa]EKV1241258.1 hypothetical protein [Pseudomonas aeruginosa]EKV8586167.1 hypothetical protein [Pseudomonas aeruginosa]ELN5407385.1 hypothetical protein [Pseudomonas aeruginosa]ELP1438576.1 hypothetical protein [Pseudomonas aeruginosa]THB16466.1 hypothetical protein E6W26_29145 [Pseudomonas aeruginosa]
MKTQILSLIALALMASATQAATYTALVPLDGASINFVNKGSGGDNGNGSGTGGGTETGGSDNGTQEPAVPEIPTDPAEQCTSYASAASSFFNQSYPDVHVLNHDYKTQNIIGVGTVTSCSLTVEYPMSKSQSCTGSNTYPTSVSDALFIHVGSSYGKIGKTQVMSYYGSCN